MTNIPIQKSRERSWFLAVLAAMLAVVLRVYSLDSDPYNGISWDTGLFTDEGFYIHNARNVALFGTFQTDDFNNALIMPTLHYVQTAAFLLFGVGEVQARLISVVFGLLTLPVLWDGARRLFSARVATVAALFLALDHTVIGFNRMALMDTPAAFALVCGFACFARAVTVSEERGRFGWAFGCGVALIIAYATRGLAALVLPAPFLAVWFGMREASATVNVSRRTLLKGLICGILVGVLVYLCAWYLPHRVELTRLNRYYLTEQLLPKTVNQLRLNALQSLWGEFFTGLFPYLFRHLPAHLTLLFLLAVEWRRVKELTSFERIGAIYAVCWVAGLWAFFGVVNYAPSRYYPLFYPAFGLLVGLAWERLEELLPAFWNRRWLRAAVVSFLAFQFADIFLDRDGGAVRAIAIITAVCFAVCFALPPITLTMEGARRLGVVFLALWLSVNLGWTLHWLTHRTFARRDADAWLAQNLPPNAVVFGDCAPGLCINNRFPAINVIPKLCNDARPLERFPNVPRYLAILDGDWKGQERFWIENYPDLIEEKRRVQLFPWVVLRPIGIYH